MIDTIGEHVTAPTGLPGAKGCSSRRIRGSEAGSGEFFGDDLVAQRKALGADTSGTGSQARFRRLGGQAGDETAMLAAEAALCPLVPLRYGMHRGPSRVRAGLPALATPSASPTHASQM
jgi:hypothetical protein